jgi:hypothetical protein
VPFFFFFFFFESNENAFGVFNRTRRWVRALREMVAELADEEESEGEEEGKGQRKDGDDKQEEGE